MAELKGAFAVAGFVEEMPGNTGRSLGFLNTADPETWRRIQTDDPCRPFAYVVRCEWASYAEGESYEVALQGEGWHVRESAPIDGALTEYAQFVKDFDGYQTVTLYVLLGGDEVHSQSFDIVPSPT